MFKPVTFIWTIRKRMKLTWALLKDERVPMWQKAIPFLPLIYIFSPLNFLTFAIPVIGQIDDVFLVMLALELFERVVDKTIIAEYRPEDTSK
jgi:uncharacterized membrane protein YkvA (DUF1232 family)